MDKTLLLIDGNSIINRAYYGLAGRTQMQAPDGTPTGALYAFLNIYFRFYEQTSPDYVCFCFDLKGPTFRHKKYDKYKAHRKPMPDDLALQIPILKEILDNIGLPRVELDGYEADDLIGSISKKSKEKNIKTIILTGDKDDLQLVDDSINVLMPITTKGQTDTLFFDETEVFNKYKITPSQFIDFKAIMGDPSDNIPGVKGIGEKGATDLLVKYKSLENIYINLEELSAGVKNKLEASKEIAFLSRELATIKCDLPVEKYFDEIINFKSNYNNAYQILKRLGFNSIIKRMDVSLPESVIKAREKASKKIDDKEIKSLPDTNFCELIDIKKIYKFDLSKLINSNKSDKVSIKDIVQKIKESSGLSDECFTDKLSEIIKFEDSGYIIVHNLSSNKLLLDINADVLYSFEKSQLINLTQYAKENKIRIVGFGLKDILRKENIYAHELLLFDVLVAGYVLNQFDGKVTVEKLATSTLGEDMVLHELNDLDNSPRQQSLFDENIENLSDNNDEKISKYQIYLLNKIAKIQFEEICESGLFLLAINIEMPLTGILAEMEAIGIRVDESILNDFNLDVTKKINDLEKNIYELANEEFNINSPKQLAKILFENLSLPTGKKGQTGYSTNIDVLEKLKDKHPIINEIINYRQLSKLKSTFIEGLMSSIDKKDKRIHTSFHQTLTSTGRLSSSNPNLQNIPIKLEEGREIRKAFVAKNNYSLVDADYSQIELRLLASLCNDQSMINAFINGDDIHMNTATEMFDLPKEMITPAMRSMAKTINFSIVYGIGEYSLSADLGITMKEAKKYIEEYHNKYPAVKPYFNALIKKAHETSYVETMFKRRRYIHELKSANRNIISFGERAAMNTPVQGSAADIIKIAMVVVHNTIRNKRLDANLILQVHDELIIEAKDEISNEVAKILQESMEKAISLCVPLSADAHIKKNWYY